MFPYTELILMRYVKMSVIESHIDGLVLVLGDSKYVLRNFMTPENAPFFAPG